MIISQIVLQDLLLPRNAYNILPEYLKLYVEFIWSCYLLRGTLMHTHAHHILRYFH